MDTITYLNGAPIAIKELAALYEDAGWEYYLRNLEVLREAYANSLRVISAWDQNKLVGVIRAVGDGCTILYIQDILVLSEYHRQGIGRGLLGRMLEEFPNVRQKVLMTDNQPGTVAFYTNMGFSPVSQYHGVAFVRYELGKCDG